MWQGLTDYYAKLPMGMTAENLAEKYNITRQECDEFALLTQKRWAEGNKIKSKYLELTGQCLNESTFNL